MRVLALTVLLIACAPELEPTEAPPLQRSPEEREAKRVALESLEVLLHPTSQLTIGSACYMGGLPPLGRMATERLVEQGRADLLRRALAAPSPEGRLYAAMGLARLGAISPAELRSLAARESEVEVCDGCFVQRVSAADAVEGCSCAEVPSQ